MQDRYVGDVGDFGKYGLLQALAGMHDGKPKLSLGIVWYRTRVTARENNADDGKHRRYLNKGHEYRDCAPDLFERLKHFQDTGQRNVELIAPSGIFPTSTVYYDPVLSFSTVPSNNEARLLFRRQWFQGALQRVYQSELVFLDPDNGIEVDSVHQYSNYGPKYVNSNELSSFLECENKSIILYQHSWRCKNFVGETLQRVGKLCLGRIPFAVVFHRGTQRAFIIIPSKLNHSLLLNRTEQFIQSNWKRHFKPNIYFG
jgi:hypothetical protein